MFFEDFDPVVTRLITDASHRPLWQVEPAFDSAGRWQPSWWTLVNQVWKPEGAEQRLVAIPAQYRSTTLDRGTERVFEAMTYTVYYSSTLDFVPPSIWSVSAYQQAGVVQVVVEATDLSDVMRVGAAYTHGDGVWRTADLLRSAASPNLRTGAMPLDEEMEWFVQAIDGGGNVAFNDNKGAYFGAPSNLRTWLPVVYREYQ